MTNILVCILILLILYSFVHTRRRQFGSGDLMEMNSDYVLTLFIILVVIMIIGVVLYRTKQDISSCQSAQFGCCPDGTTPRTNTYGTNCTQYPTITYIIPPSYHHRPPHHRHHRPPRYPPQPPHIMG